MVEASYGVSGVGPTVFARNGGGDPYFTDGETAVSRLSPDCRTVPRRRRRVSPRPPAVAAKNATVRLGEGAVSVCCRHGRGERRPANPRSTGFVTRIIKSG